MREILFRGKSVLDGNWVHGFYYNTDDNLKCNIRHIIMWRNNGPGRQQIEEPVNPETVSQYIGIKDIHDTKVFQGDIVRCKETIYKDCSKKEIKEVREFVGEVVWYQYGWYIAEKIKEVIPKGIKTGIKFHNLLLWDIEDNKDDTMEILGNRWDNPDMAVVESA